MAGGDATLRRLESPPTIASTSAAPPETVEAWAYDFVVTTELEHKLRPPALPREWSEPSTLEPIRIEQPGRPRELRVAERGRKTPGLDALRDPRQRAQLLHTFLHHELQAAELMCRTVLAHPETPAAFRRGLISICRDEVRHMGWYAAHIEKLGHHYGDFSVNDWFWRRLPIDVTPLQFVALMALGFEGANLDHTERFAELFEQVGDHEGAELQRKIGAEEEPHVAFGAHWFQRLGGEALTFESWQAALPPPLSPRLLRGRTIGREARLRAGYPADFIDAFIAWTPEP